MISASSAIALLSSGEAVSPDDFGQLWSSDHQGFRTQIAEWISETVERDGSTSGTAWPAILRRHLTPDNIQELFLYVRNRAARLEPEWRPSFAADFHVNDSSLPQYDVGHGLMYYSLRLLQAFARLDEEEALAVVTEALSRGIPVSQVYYSADELSGGGVNLSLASEQPTAAEVATALGMQRAASALAA